MSTSAVDGAAATEWQQTYPPIPESTRAARELVRAAAAPFGQEFTDLAVLLASELAANAIRHARTDFTLAMQRSAESLRVSVRDRSLEPVLVPELQFERGSGRGLRIVQAFAERWGVETSTRGKTVWFELRLPHERRAQPKAPSSKRPRPPGS